MEEEIYTRVKSGSSESFQQDGPAVLLTKTMGWTMEAEEPVLLVMSGVKSVF